MRNGFHNWFNEFFIAIIFNIMSEVFVKLHFRSILKRT